MAVSIAPPMNGRVSKEVADYTPNASSMAERCARCTHFMPNPGGKHDACHIVAGDIQPIGWCKFFEKKEWANASRAA